MTINEQANTRWSLQAKLNTAFRKYTKIKHQLSFFILTVFKIPERKNGGKEYTADLY